MRFRPALLIVGAAVAVAALVILLNAQKIDGYVDSDAEKTIFVSVASFRDDECHNTINQLFSKADKPDRIFVGTCEQNAASPSEWCVPASFKYHSNIRRILIPAQEAKGPTYARAMIANTLFRDETYYLCIDSHTDFVPGWDTKAVASLAKCPSGERSILSHYPPSRENAGTAVPVLCQSKFNEQGIPTFEAVTLAASPVPRRVPFVAGGFMFARGKVLREVPMHSTDYLFQGEEFLLSARLFCAGWDVFTPTENIVVHHYIREGKPKVWEDNPEYWKRQDDATRTVRRTLGLEEPSLETHMGTVRTMQQYWEFCGLDPVAKTSQSKQKFCG